MKLICVIALIMCIQGYMIAVMNPNKARAAYRAKSKRSNSVFIGQESVITLIEVLVLGRALGWW